MTGLYYYKLISPYSDDVTKDCKLTINEIDSNFFNLKSADIKSAQYVKDENLKGTLVLTKNNDEKIVVPIDPSIDKNITYDFNASAEQGDKNGTTLTITWKDNDDEEKTTKIENIITSDNLLDVVGSDLLTKVITDGSLKGLGTMKSPLRISGVEKTGMLAPAIKVIDLTDPTTLPLPTETKMGTRYVTKEYVNDYGYLYNGNGAVEVQELLDNEWENKEIYKEVKNRTDYWRVPTKADWDKLLNSIEPCDYQNHNSSQCHAELGKLAGKFLKSECGWLGQEECTCSGTKPYSSCTTTTTSNADDVNADDYIFDNTDTSISEQEISPSGIDRFGMTILPAGYGFYKHEQQRFDSFKESAYFWTSTHIYNDPKQDVFVKVFDWDKSGVSQVAECPNPYYSVRLVKDYDGSNFKEAEYIDGVLYRTVLFPETKQIWLATNFVNEVSSDNMLVPNGKMIIDQRVELFINEYNGRYWEKRALVDGETIVVQVPYYEGETSGRTKEVCWTDESGVTQCYEIEINPNPYKDTEYRVVTEDDCNKTLVNTDDFIIDNVLTVIGGIIYREKFELLEAIERERIERESADTIIMETVSSMSFSAISGVEIVLEALEEEINARISGDSQEREDRENAINEILDVIDSISGDTVLDELKLMELSGKIDTEIADRTDADNILQDAIVAEETRATDAENALNDRIDDILGLTIDTSSGYTMSASGELVLRSKDGIDAHFVKIKLDGNFGTISF